MSTELLLKVKENLRLLNVAKSYGLDASIPLIHALNKAKNFKKANRKVMAYKVIWKNTDLNLRNTISLVNNSTF